MSALSLEDFLTGAKTALHSAIKQKEKVTLVMGDEHADLDSVVSSILFSYLRTASPPSGAWSQVYIPLVNAEWDEMSARNILQRLLPEVGLSNTHLIGVEDLVHHGNTRSGLSAENTRFFLLDHNIMLGRKDQNYSENVLGCIDHHKDENYVPTSTDPEPRIIGQSGSCTSLVVNWGAKEWSYLEGSGNETAQLQLSKLALAPILLDTENLSGSSTTEEDTRAVEFLEQKIQASEGSSGSYDRTAFYQSLSSGGGNISSIDTAGATTTTTTTDTTDTTTATSPRTQIGSTGFYDPFAKEATTGATGFATDFKGDVGTAGTAASTEIPTTSASGYAGETTSTSGYTGPETTEDTTTAPVTDSTSTTGGGITGAVSGVLSYFTGGGKKDITEEETAAESTEATTQEAAGTSSTQRAAIESLEATTQEAAGTTSGNYPTTGASTVGSGTGSYDPANDASTGASPSATRLEGNSTIGETTTTSDATAGSGGLLSSRLPWFSPETVDNTSELTENEAYSGAERSGTGGAITTITDESITGEPVGQVLSGPAHISGEVFGQNDPEYQEIRQDLLAHSTETGNEFTTGTSSGLMTTGSAVESTTTTGVTGGSAVDTSAIQPSSTAGTTGIDPTTSTTGTGLDNTTSSTVGTSAIQSSGTAGTTDIDPTTSTTETGMDNTTSSTVVDDSATELSENTTPKKEGLFSKLKHVVSGN